MLRGGGGWKVNTLITYMDNFTVLGPNYLSVYSMSLLCTLVYLDSPASVQNPRWDTATR